MSKACRLTTYDNHYNPFTDFVHWYNYDMLKGYNTSSLLARFTSGLIDDSMTEDEIDEVTEKAIDRVLAIDFECIYRKVYEDEKFEPIQSPLN